MRDDVDIALGHQQQDEKHILKCAVNKNLIKLIMECILNLLVPPTPQKDVPIYPLNFIVVGFIIIIIISIESDSTKGIIN